MEMLFDVISKIVGIIPSIFERILAALVPESFRYICYGWLPVVVAFLIGRTILHIMLKGEEINIENANNKGIYFPYNYKHVYKSLSKAKNIRLGFKIFAGYMMLLNLRLITTTLASASTDWIIRNIVWVIIGVGAVALMMVCLTGREHIGSFWMHSDSDSVKVFATCGVVILGCRMISDMFDNIQLSTLAAVVLCSYFTMKDRNGYSLMPRQTIDYFKGKDQHDTFVDDKPEPWVLKEIDDHIPSLGEVTRPIDNLYGAGNLVRSPEFFISRPTMYCSNEEYLDNMNAATVGGVPFAGSTSQDWDSVVATMTEETLKRADENGYSADQYEEEGIKKVFDALGYDREPSRENYVEFRKSANLLADIYTARIREQKYLWREAFDERYPVISSGVTGEKLVEKALRKYAERGGVYVFPGYYFEYAEKSHTECDFIVVSEKGIFCIEVKTYGLDADYSLEIKRNGEWYKCYGSQLHRIEGDPFQQNEFHAQAFKKTFGKELAKLTSDGSMPEVHEIMVIASNISLDNDSAHKVVHIGELTDTLDKRIELFDADKVKIFAEALKKADDSPMKTEKTDFVAWKNKIDALELRRDAISNLTSKILLTEKYRIMDK